MEDIAIPITAFTLVVGLHRLRSHGPHRTITIYGVACAGTTAMSGTMGTMAVVGI